METLKHSYSIGKELEVTLLDNTYNKMFLIQLADFSHNLDEIRHLFIYKGWYFYLKINEDCFYITTGEEEYSSIEEVKQVIDIHTEHSERELKELMNFLIIEKT